MKRYHHIPPLLTLFGRLLAGEALTVRDLSNVLDLGYRSARYIFDALCTHPAVERSREGRATVIRLDDTFGLLHGGKLRSSRSPSVSMALALMRLQVAPWHATTLWTDTNAFLDALEGQSPALSNVAGRWHNRLHVVVPDVPEDGGLLETVLSGVMEQRWLTLTVEGELVSRAPLTLLFAPEGVKVVGQKMTGELELLALSSIEEAELSPQRFVHPRGYDAAEAAERLLRGGEAEQLELW